jgi:hypothetical protein
MWHQLKDEQKVPFTVEANRLRDEHRLANPGYRYQPKRRTKLVASTIETSPQTKDEAFQRAGKKRPASQVREAKHANGKRVKRVHESLSMAVKGEGVEPRLNYYGGTDKFTNGKSDLEIINASEELKK